jgi:pimeloyl-ACP methyl ester carboxylesterase
VGPGHRRPHSLSAGTAPADSPRVQGKADAADGARRGMCGRLPALASYRSSTWRRGIGHGRRVRGSENHWLLLHGTPLTPAVWDGVAACLTRSGTVFAPAITPADDGRDAQGALAARLTTEVARASGRLHVVGHSFGGQVALDFALLVPQQVATLTLLCSRDTPFPAFATAAARLRGGAAVEPTPRSAGGSPPPSWTGAGRSSATHAAACSKRPPVVGGCAGCHRPLRPGRPHRLHPDPGHAHRSRTRPGVYSGGHVGPGQPPAQGYPADPARRRAHDTLHRSSRPGRAHPPRRQAMIAGSPATPPALPNPTCPIPDPKEPRTRSLAVLFSREPGRHRATSGR